MKHIAFFVLLLAFMPAYIHANQGASLVSKAEFINLKDSANGKIIAKLQKSDFLLTITAGGTDSANPNFVRVSVDDQLAGVLHKRDIVILDEKDYQAYIQSLIKQIITSLSAPYQEALRSDDPTLLALSQKVLDSTFAPQSEIGREFRARRVLLNQLAQKSYQQALESAIALGFANTASLLLDEKGISLNGEPSPEPAKIDSSLESTKPESSASTDTSAHTFAYQGDLLLRAITAPKPRAKIITELLAHGAKPNTPYPIPNQPGHTAYALTTACALGLYDIAKLLIDSDASLSPESSPSPLIIAIAVGEPTLAHYLLDSGAQLSRAGKPNEYDMLYTILESLPEHPDHQKALEIFELALESGIDTENLLYKAATNGNLEVTQILLQKGAKSNGEKSCIIQHGRWHCSPLIATLEALFANAPAPLDSSASQAPKASLESRLGIIKLLLQYGADRTITNDKGEDLKAWIASHHSPLQEQICALLDSASAPTPSTAQDSSQAPVPSTKDASLESKIESSAPESSPSTPDTLVPNPK